MYNLNERWRSGRQREKSEEGRGREGEKERNFLLSASYMKFEQNKSHSLWFLYRSQKKLLDLKFSLFHFLCKEPKINRIILLLYAQLSPTIHKFKRDQVTYRLPRAVSSNKDEAKGEVMRKGKNYNQHRTIAEKRRIFSKMKNWNVLSPERKSKEKK